MGKSSKLLFGALLGATAAVLLSPVSRKKAQARVTKIAKDAGLDTTSITQTLSSVFAKGSRVLKDAEKKGAQSRTANKTKKQHKHV